MMKMQFVSAVMVAMTQSGELPTAPILFPLEVKENSIEAKQTSKELDFLGQCCGKKVIFGAKEVTGSMSGNLTSGSAAVIYQHMFGTKDSEVNATTESWAANTVVGFGSIVNHSNGTHTLVCTKSGTTGATEPTVGTVGKKIVDGSCHWVAVNLMKKLSVTSNKKPRAVAVEKKFKKDDGTFMYVRYENVIFSKSDIVSSGKDVEMNWNIDATGATVTDSLDDGFVALADMANAKTIKPFDDLFMNDESTGGTCAFRDGVAAEEYDEMSFTVERKVEKSSCVPKKVGNGFVAYAPIVSANLSAKGKFSIYANETDYANFKEHTPFDAAVTLQNNLASKVTVTFKEVVPNYSDISIENCMDSKLDTELFVTGGCNTVSPITLEVVYPQLVDTTGAVVDYFA